MNERIFYLSGHESLEEMKEKITQCNADGIIFLFPRKSWIFHQNTDLQALRDTMDASKKNFTIVTKNALARTRIQAVGIPVLASLEDREKTPFAQMRTQKDSEFSAKKISNIPIETIRNASQKKKYLQKGDIESLKLKISPPVIHALVLLGIFLFAFFLFLLKVAIVDARVEITPFQKEEEMHINVHMLSSPHFTETDLWRENNGIFTYPIEEIYEVKKTFTHITQEFQGKNASGKMQITNHLSTPLTLRSGTRIKNKKGVVFLLSDWVTVPATKGGKNGVISVSVEAAERDDNLKFQGEKANMPKGQQFFFPGLPDDMRTQVIAENTTEMIGGETKWINKISEDDIKRAKASLEEMAQKKKKEEIEYGVAQRFAPEENMGILPASGKQFEFEVLDISFDTPEEDLIGQDRTEFSGKTKVRVKNYVYSKNALFGLIAEKFKKNAPEGMELLSIDTHFLHPEVLNTYEENTRIKVSFSTRGVYQYVIEPKSKKGLIFSQKIKKEIIGKNQDEAKKILINNFKEISDVSISLWPFWVNNLPTLPEKIYLETKTSKPKDDQYLSQ